MRSSWKKVLAFNCILTGALLAALFLCGEIYYRFIYDDTDSNALSLTTLKWSDRHWRVNNWGARDNVDYAPKRDGRRRITFVGDSFTAGYGVKNIEDCFPQIIRREHPEWDVQVFARPGWDTQGHIDVLRMAAERGYELDVVVLMYNLNDVDDIMPGWSMDLSAAMTNSFRGGWLCQNSYLVNTLYHKSALRRHPAMAGYFDRLESAYGGETWDEQQGRLEALKCWVDVSRARLCVITFPLFNKSGDVARFNWIPNRLAGFWYSIGVPHQTLWFPFRFPGKDLVVSHHDYHPNELAHAHVAIALEAFLATQIESQSTEPVAAR